MQARGYIYIMSVSAVVAGGCKKHYSPPAITANYNYLVVEGVIPAGGDSTIIKLSRTISISGQDKNRYEIGSKVVINDDQGASYPLPEVDSGRYAVLPVTLNILYDCIACKYHNHGSNVKPAFWK